jgi:hypothetical protein
VRAFVLGCTAPWCQHSGFAHTRAWRVEVLCPTHQESRGVASRASSAKSSQPQSPQCQGRRQAQEQRNDRPQDLQGEAEGACFQSKPPPNRRAATESVVASTGRESLFVRGRPDRSRRSRCPLWEPTMWQGRRTCTPLFRRWHRAREVHCAPSGQARSGSLHLRTMSRRQRGSSTHWGVIGRSGVGHED